MWKPVISHGNSGLLQEHESPLPTTFFIYKKDENGGLRST
jgi:hypothetical protein